MRTITTVEELAALPLGSIVLTPVGGAEVRYSEGDVGRHLRTFNGANHRKSTWEQRMLPVLVLYVPDEVTP